MILKNSNYHLNRNWYSFIGLPVFLTIMLLGLSCKELPTDPRNASNATMNLSLKSSKGITGQQVTDSVGKTITVMAALRYPEFIKSTAFTIASEQSGALEYTTTLTSTSTATFDTVQFQFPVTTSGNKIVYATSTVNTGATLTDTAYITIQGATSTTNTKPVITVAGTVNLIPGQVCTLTVTVTDPDAGQTNTVTVTNDNISTPVTNGRYYYTAASSFTGKDTLYFITIDNGTPSPLSDTATVIIQVAETRPDAPQQLRVSAQTTSSVTLIWEKSLRAVEYAIYRSATLDAATFTKIKDSLTATEFTDLTGGSIWYYYVIARNAAGVSDASNKVSSDTTVNIAPKWDIETLTAVLTCGTSYTLSLKDSCFDANGDTLTFTLLSSSKGVINGGIYTFNATAADTGVQTVLIEAADQKKLTDTLTITITVSASDKTPPKLTRVAPANDTTVINGSSYSVQMTCTDASGIALITCISGAAAVEVVKTTDSLYTANITSVASTGYTRVLFTAIDSAGNKDSLAVHLISAVVAVDTTPPVIVLTQPAKDSTKVGTQAVSVDVTCTDASGIADVSCKLGTTVIPVAKGTGDLYTAAVSGLVAGANILTFTATDKAAVPKTSTLSVTVIYDASITDNVGPTITLKYPALADMRVLTDTVTVQVECVDVNGISSVTASRAGTALTVTNTGSLYAVNLTALTAGKSDTVTFTAIDNSPNKNPRSISAIVRYNRMPGAVTLSTPLNNATGVALIPTLVWTGGDDPDGDIVSYTVMYGTTASSLTRSISGLTAKTVTFASSLLANTAYYWQVIAKTPVNGDSVLSDIWAFTIVEDAPVITVDPVNQSVAVGNKATFTVTATGTSLKYQWQKGGVDITGATSATLTTSATTSADNGASYCCVVSNAGGSKTSAAATLTIQYGLTYNVNNGTGTPPTDANTYAAGEAVTVKDVSALTRSGFTFAGWNRAADGSGSKNYVANDTLIMGAGNLTLYAVWTQIPTYAVVYNGNGFTGGTLPAAAYYEAGATVTVAASSLTRTNYIFASWNTAADGTGTDYVPGQTFSIGTTPVTLFAKWTELPTCTVTYNNNGATGGTVPVDATRYHEGETVLTLDNSGSLVRTGYIFSGWNTKSDGTGTEYIAGTGTFLMGTMNVTLYAKWIIKDICGNTYTEVTIGTQVWMVENLLTTKYNDNTDIPTTRSESALALGSFYAGDAIYGAYYDGYAVNTGKLAPAGWHVPTVAEWKVLFATIKDSAIYIASPLYWTSYADVGTPGYNNGAANNSTGFSAIPSGKATSTIGNVSSKGTKAYFWSSVFGTEEGYLYGYFYFIENCSSNILDDYNSAYSYYSVRLIRDY